MKVTLDNFHSHLLDRMVLRDGLVSSGIVHSAKPNEADPVQIALQEHIEENLDDFSSVQTWQHEADQTLSLMSLFPDIQQTAQTFTWQSNQLAPPLILKDSALSDVQAHEWEAAIERALATVRLTGTEQLYRTMTADPSFLFRRYNETSAPGISRSIFDQNTTRYWTYALAPKIMRQLASYYRSLPLGMLPSQMGFVEEEAQGVLEDILPRDEKVGVEPVLEEFCKYAFKQIDDLVRVELDLSDDPLCTSIRDGEKRLDLSLDGVATLVRADFSKCLSVIPAPRNLNEAFELREKPEIARIGELLSQWANAASNEDQRMETFIARDLSKAQKELHRFEQIRKFEKSDIGIWIKFAGAQIPIVSNILSAAEVGLHYLDKTQLKRNIWVSTSH